MLYFTSHLTSTVDDDADEFMMEEGSRTKDLTFSCGSCYSNENGKDNENVSD